MNPPPVPVNLDISSPLCKIMNKCGSDKGTKHNYSILYYEMFKHLQDKPITVFELGIGTNNVKLPSNMGADGVPGASLRGWKQFFPQAQVYGADIDKNILFKEDRITTVWCDQTKPEIISEMWKTIPDCDIIVEDGLHEFAANVCFFESSIHKLKSGGYFVIEDIHYHDHQKFANKIKEWSVKYPNLNFSLTHLPTKKRVDDNTLLIAIKV